MKAIVIETSPEDADTVSLCLQMRWPGTAVVALRDGAEAVERLTDDDVDLVVLDRDLNGVDGIQLCGEIRRASPVPIIMLSTRMADTDVARGLESGADDYIKKPISTIEFQARANAVMRRVHREQGAPVDETPFVSGELRVDFARHEVWLRGEQVRLTPIEFNILGHLVKNADRVVPHQELLTKVWGPERVDANNYLKVHVQHLRQKLGDDSHHPRMIMTHWKVGYRFNEAATRVGR
jgi:DNA-binding response OmpR family regulator